MLPSKSSKKILINGFIATTMNGLIEAIAIWDEGLSKPLKKAKLSKNK